MPGESAHLRTVGARYGDAVIFEQRDAPPGFGRLVTRLWYLDAPRTARYEKILPLPYLHLIVNLSDPYRLIDEEGRAAVVDGAFVAGLRTNYLISELPLRLRNVGIEFTPVGLDALTRARGSRRAGPSTGGRVLAASGLLDGTDELLARVSADPTPAATLDALSEFLACTPPSEPDPVAAAVLDAISGDPDTSIEGLAQQLGTSRRTLSHRFRQATGLTPKTFALVWRFHCLVASAQSASPPDWAALAASSGYYDQPQVIRAFRRFSGWTPVEHHRRIAAFGPAEAYFVPLEELPAAIRRDHARS